MYAMDSNEKSRETSKPLPKIKTAKTTLQNQTKTHQYEAPNLAIGAFLMPVVQMTASGRLSGQPRAFNGRAGTGSAAIHHVRQMPQMIDSRQPCTT